MRKQLLTVSVALMSISSLAQAHVSYTGRDLGSFDALSAASVSIANQVVTGNYGWADAADADYGDSHKGRWFKFTLGQATDVTLSVSANSAATSTSIGGLLPSFSLYSGLAPSAAYDNSAISTAYRSTLGFTTEGAWNARGNFSIGNDSGVISQLTLVDYAANTGAASQVSKTFNLAAGTYSLIVGGSDYNAQFDTTATNFAKSYGLKVDLAVAAVPEPETYAMFMAGLGLMGLVARRRNRRQG